MNETKKKIEELLRGGKHTKEEIKNIIEADAKVSKAIKNAIKDDIDNSEWDPYDGWTEYWDDDVREELEKLMKELGVKEEQFNKVYYTVMYHFAQYDEGREILSKEDIENCVGKNAVADLIWKKVQNDKAFGWRVERDSMAEIAQGIIEEAAAELEIDEEEIEKQVSTDEIYKAWGAEIKKKYKIKASIKADGESGDMNNYEEAGLAVQDAQKQVQSAQSALKGDAPTTAESLQKIDNALHMIAVDLFEMGKSKPNEG